ncbi:MAG TPA: lytic transglycosylase domain-containing protein [Caulobacteraceae bacterium]|jgi:soluble lytic murein transglycosylase-like protein
MVGRFVAALAALACGQPAAAQTVDWSRAGGSLFAGAEIAPPERPEAPSPLAATPPEETDVRIGAAEQPYAEAIAKAAARHGLDPKLLHALVVVESAYRATAVSPVGAAGLTQLMPGTAADLGVRNRMDPLTNLQGGAAYLARQVVRFGDVRLALAAYNAGPERVARLGRIPAIPETQAYVTAVVDCYLALSAGRGVRSSRECAGGKRR